MSQTSAESQTCTVCTVQCHRHRLCHRLVQCVLSMSQTLVQCVLFNVTDICCVTDLYSVYCSMSQTSAVSQTCTVCTVQCHRHLSQYCSMSQTSAESQTCTVCTTDAFTFTHLSVAAVSPTPRQSESPQTHVLRTRPL